MKSSPSEVDNHDEIRQTVEYPDRSGKSREIPPRYSGQVVAFKNKIIYT